MPVETKFFSRIVRGLCIVELVFQGANIQAWRATESQSQEPPQSGPVAQKIVTLSVTILDKDDLPVRDVKQGEFRLLEDGKEQGIRTFAFGTRQPLVLGLLMQWSGQRRDTLPYAEIDPAGQFFRTLLTKHDVSYAARFAGTAQTLADFINDPSEIDRGLRAAMSVPYYGPSALFDSLVWACEEKLSTRPGRRVLLLVADGHDNASRKSLSDAIKCALRSQTTIYVVSLARANPFLTKTPVLPPPVLELDHSELKQAIHVMSELAGKTGGEAIFVQRQEDLARAFDNIDRELRNQYLVEFSPNNETHHRSFHRIKIEVKGQGLRVLVPEGYFASQ